MTALGQTLTLGLTLPLLGGAGAAIKFASDAAESASKFDVVFGGAAADVGRAIVEMRKTIPATTADLKGMTSEIQDLLVPMGLAPGAAKDMTLQVVQLAADLASFNNIPMAEALERIRSGLVGQNEPLLKFGVAINAAAVQDEAFRLGLIKTTKEALTPAERAQATFALIVQNTTAAQGDAARTAEGTANQFKFLKSETIEAATAFGVLLLPAVTSVISTVTKAVTAFGEMQTGTKVVILVVGGLVAAIGPLLLVAGSAASAFVALSSAAGILGVSIGALVAPFALGVVAFGSIVAAGVAVANNWAVIRFEVKNLIDVIAAQFARLKPIFDLVGAGTDKVVGFFSKMFDVLVGHSIVPELMDKIGGQFDRLDPIMVSPAQTAADRVNAAFKSIANPEALRALDFDVSMDASQLYAAVIVGGEQLNARWVELANKTSVATAATDAFTVNIEGALNEASALAEQHRLAEQAAANMRHQQEILAQIVGTKEIPTRNVNIAAMAAQTSSTHAITAAMATAGTATQKFSTDTQVSSSFFARALESAGGLVSSTGSVLGSSLSKLGGGALDLLAKFSPMGLATETLQRVFKELEPAIKAVEPIVVILAKALAAGLMPILQALFPVIKLIAIAFTFAGEIVYRVAQGFLLVVGNVVRAIGKLIDALPFVSGKGIIEAGENLLNTADSMGDAARAMHDARDALSELTWPAEAQSAAAEQLAGTNAITDAVSVNAEQTEAAVLAIREGAGILTSLRDITRAGFDRLDALLEEIAGKEWSPTIQLSFAGGPSGGGVITSGGAGGGGFALDDALSGNINVA